ncbi:MAG TPA: hypothetical protein VF171_04195, partial [Trueperaceae bacterium]
QGRTHQQGGGQQTQGGRSKAGKTSSEPSQSTRQNGGQNDEQQPGAAPKQNAGGQQSAPGEAGQAEGKQQDEAAGNPTQAQGDPQSAKEKLQGGAGQGAGTKASTPLPGQTPRGVAQGQLESLQGRFRGGPSTIGGQVLIPGLADKPLPEGQAATGFRHALEKAVTEGRIPVEYQQILRDYYK